MLRSCYRTNFRGLTPDGSLVPVRWYVANVPHSVPFGCSFNSPNWDSYVPDPRPVGDVRQRHQEWVDGSGPGAPCCEEPFGEAQAWLLGWTPGQPLHPTCVWVDAKGVIAEASGAIGSFVVGRRLAGVIREASGAVGDLVFRPGGRPPNLIAEASGAIGSLVVGRQVAGGIVEASGASGSLSAGHAVAGGIVEASGAIGSLSMSPANPLITGCAPCSVSGIYTRWTLTCSGSSGTGTDDPNGSLLLQNNAGSVDCRWFDPNGSVGGAPYWVGGPFGSVTGWTAFFVNGGFSSIATYKCDPFDCTGTNTFTYDSSSYGVWPTTITITPGP